MPQIGARKEGLEVESNEVQSLTLPPLSSTERDLTLNEFEHVELKHWVLDFEDPFQDRLLSQHWCEASQKIGN